MSQISGLMDGDVVDPEVGLTVAGLPVVKVGLVVGLYEGLPVGLPVGVSVFGLAVSAVGDAVGVEVGREVGLTVAGLPVVTVGLLVTGLAVNG